jgi:hypothetical protein
MFWSPDSEDAAVFFFASLVFLGRRVPSTQFFSILFSARVDWPGH